MALTNAGRNFIATAIMNSGPPTFFDNSNAKIGVGDGNAVFDVGQTDLQGTNKLRKAMEATYPTIATNVLTLRSLFGTSEANWNWLEWGTFNAAPTGGVMLQRKQEDLGTKTSAQSWQITVDLTVTAA